MKPAFRDSHWATALAAALLLAWVCFFVSPGLQPGRTLLGTDLLGRFPPWSDARPPGWEAANPMLFDQATQFFPWRTLERALGREGLPPLWNPFAAAGSPLLANYQSAPFAPVQLAVSRLPWDVAPAVAAGLRLALAALGMLLLLRALGAGPPAAVFGALAFVGSGAVTVLLYHPNSDVSCWLPLAAYLSLRVARRGDGVDGAWLALVLGAQYLGGHPETSVFVACGSLAVFLVGLALRRPEDLEAVGAVGALATVAVAHLLGLLLAAVQILPFAEYLNASGIVGERAAMHLANSPSAAVGLVAPQIFGSPLRPNTFFGPGNYHDLAMQYTGVATLVCALAGVARWAARRRSGPWRAPGSAQAWIAPTAVLALGALLLAYPTPLWRLAHLVAPLRVVAGVVGLTLLYCFGVAVLAALALEGMRPAAGDGDEPAGARRAPVVLAALVAVVAAAALAAWLALPQFRERLLAQGARVMRARYDPAVASQPLEHYLAKLPAILAAVRHSLLVSGALGAGLAALLCLRRRMPAVVFAALAVALLAADLAQFGRGYVPAVGTADALARGGWEALLQRADVARVLPTGRALPANTLTLWGVEDFRVYDAIGTAAHARFERPQAPAAPLRRRFADYRRELLDAAGVGAVVSEQPLAEPGLVPLADSARAWGAGSSLFVYRNEDAWPHAFVVERDQGTADDEDAVARTVAAVRGAASAAGPDGERIALPRVAVLSAAQAGTGVAAPELWAAIEWLYPGLLSPGSAAGAGVGGWLGDSAAARRRLWRSETVYRLQGTRAVRAGALVRGPLAVAGTVSAPRGGWLVVLDQDYRGWEARVDGAAAEPVRAFGLFRAVPLDPGRHEVAWAYRPESFAIGCGLSLIALAGVLLWLLLARAGGQRSAPAGRHGGAPAPVPRVP